MKYISELKDGDKISNVYLCKQRTSAVTKTGKPYDSVVLQDKTGSIDGKIWEPNSIGIDDFDAKDYIEVVGDVIVYNGAPQLNIKRVRKAGEDEYRLEDYFPVTGGNIGEMYGEVEKYVDSVKNPYLSELLKGFFKEDREFIDEFKKHSAAKSVHHGYIGGLLEHTLSVTKLCDFYCTRYDILNRDLLITVALLHDMGKIYELSPFPDNDYTDDGQLLGHIIIGCEKVGAMINRIEGFPPQLANEVKHCIVAHHGELEYGSPKKPALVEALALYFADNTDAKLETMKEALYNGRPHEGTQWYGYNRLMESNIRKTGL